MGNNTYSNIAGTETYQLNVGGIIILLNDVLYILLMRRNLSSIPALVGKGFEVYLVLRKLIIEKHGHVIF